LTGEQLHAAHLPKLTVDGAVVQLQVFTGVVMELRTRTETRVTSSGGGGAIYQATGFVSGTRVSSHVTHHVELFVRDSDGNERSVRLTNVDLPVRNGSRVSTVLGIYEGHNHGYSVGIYNHDTRVWTPFDDGGRRLAPEPPVVKPLLLGAGGFGLLWVSWFPGFIALSMIACAVIWFSVALSSGVQALESQLNASLAVLRK
jgi:hypothetical protein